MTTKKILYLDMDGVLVDFDSGISSLSEIHQTQYKNGYDQAPHIFSMMKPLEGAIEAYKKLIEKFDVFILTSSPWDNETALNDKLNWVKKYLTSDVRKKVIFSHRKDLLIGDYLIDDRKLNGAQDFKGEFIHFGSANFKDWSSVLKYLL